MAESIQANLILPAFSQVLRGVSFAVTYVVTLLTTKEAKSFPNPLLVFLLGNIQILTKLFSTTQESILLLLGSGLSKLSPLLWTGQQLTSCTSFCFAESQQASSSSITVTSVRNCSHVSSHCFKSLYLSCSAWQILHMNMMMSVGTLIYPKNRFNSSNLTIYLWMYPSSF